MLRMADEISPQIAGLIEGLIAARAGDETVWTMLHRLRRAMDRPGRDLLHGKVEVDESYLSISDLSRP
jgi:hypothetical protein